MLKEERQKRILEQVRREGNALASELSELLDVSEDTIRRDLRDLAEMGLLQRVHGGAVLTAPVAAARYEVRRKENVSGKEAIARAALQLFRRGQVIIMDGGTSTLQVAQQIPRDLQVTVITNSPPIALALSEHEKIEVIVLGGTFYKDAQVTVGVETVEALRTFQADLCLLGVCSLHPEIGVSVVNLEEVYVKRAMIARSAEVAALVTAEKLSTAAPYVVGPLREITHLVTEAGVSDEALEPYAALGITLIRA
jgi:DeoR/GlpR family transcriptional regulator of sugar metabolism